MKHFCISLLFLAICSGLSSQSEGISYQAAILDNNPNEIPGIDVVGNYLSNGQVNLRFSIYDENETMEYQEVHATETDRFGMINLVIGRGTETLESPSSFNEIQWDGLPKQLGVELQYEGEDYMAFSKQDLLFIPYVSHRDITASGSLDVDGSSSLSGGLQVLQSTPTYLSGELTVDGDATFNGSTYFDNITVGNVSDLQGEVFIAGPTEMADDLTVINQSDVLFTGDLLNEGHMDIGNGLNVLNNTPTFLDGTLSVTGDSELQGNVFIEETAYVNGQVTISTSLSGGESSYNAYPLRVEGSAQGIAIKVTAGTPGRNNNYVSFLDNSGAVRGRIEGQTQDEMTSSAEYILNTAVLSADVVTAAAGLVAASTSSTICAGLGGCVTAPIPSLVVAAGINQAAAIANLAAYQIFAFENLGVTYESGSADYAEWLERLYPEEQMSYGDIVGVKGGKISKSMPDAERYMVISFKPGVLGNMPPEEERYNYEMVGFLGQVPVKVKGLVSLGDYILPSGLGDGFGRAVFPEDMKLEDYQLIVGTAWSASEDEVSAYVNTAIGMNRNDLTRVIRQQDREIKALRDRFDQLDQQLSALLPGYDSISRDEIVQPKMTEKPTSQESKGQTLSAEEFHYAIDRDLIDESLDMLKEMLQEQGLDLKAHPIYAKLYFDPEYRDQFTVDLLKEFEKAQAKAISIDKERGY